jgi:hypothetical protein
MDTTDYPTDYPLALEVVRAVQNTKRVAYKWRFYSFADTPEEGVAESEAAQQRLDNALFAFETYEFGLNVRV